MLFVQLAAFPVLAAGGIALGAWCGRRRGWWVALALALAVVGVVILGQRSQWLHFVAPMCWLINVNWNPPVMTAATSVLLTVLLVKLPQRRTRYYLGAAMGVLLVYYGLLPALLPLVVRGNLRATPTVINHKGVCLQQHGYSCGPAAAVTCLRQLGVPAEEGALAVAARCGPAVGTDGWALASAIEQYAPGVTSTYRYVATLDELRTPAVADMDMKLIRGHYVAVLEVRADGVLVGDPLSGLAVVPREEFLVEWKHAAVEMRLRARAP